MFRVGQKVICIDDSGPARPQGLVKGGTYIVSVLDGEFLGVQGIFNRLWWPSRFEPFNETDISALTALLTSVPKEKERA